MKYGETLRQRSVPAWNHYNIDYDVIKQYIKEQTSPGKDEVLLTPDHRHEAPQEFEKSLFAIFADQHQRIDLFVKSKAGEIRRRLDHSRMKLKQLSARPASVTDHRIPVGRLERFGRLENDVIKAGDEIKSLARFTSTQRTAFRKLLKKYKKWTGSTQLEDRLREEVLGDPKSFTNLDLGPLLDDYSATLLQIRTLFENKIRQTASIDAPARTGVHSGSTISQLQASIESGSKVDFDTAIATVPLGESGTFASYLVHPENIVELQIFLLQHSTYHASRSRSNSVATPIATSPPAECTSNQLGAEVADYFALEAGNAERFAEEQNALTVNDREHRPGSMPQKIEMCARWNNDEEVVVAFMPTTSPVRIAYLQRTHVYSFFDKQMGFQAKKAAVCADAEVNLAALRDEMTKDTSIRSLYEFASSRSRFVGTNNSNSRLVLATLDTGITTQNVEAGNVTGMRTTFPFGVLLVRQEGSVAGGLLTLLDQSYMVERVPGFSMEYHAIWATKKSAKIPAPFWLPVLARDIRKLPPPTLRRNASTANATPSSRGSLNGTTDSTTAVETTQSDSVTMPEGLDLPPVRAFRKKRRRPYPQQKIIEESQARYWSEYDHPEDGSEAGDAYVVYIDPNEKSTLDNVLARLGSLFGRRKSEDPEEEALLIEHTSQDDDDVSSDDGIATPRSRNKSYGTLSAARQFPSITRTVQVASPATQTRQRVPHMTAISFVASLVILAMAYILAITGRRKRVYQVDSGVLFAIASSLLFAIVGFASLFTLQDVPRPVWVIGGLILLADAVGSGGLLTWMFD